MSKKHKPKIILWDIETLPILEQVLKIFPSLSDYPGQTRKATINSMIVFGFKELDSNATYALNAWDFKDHRKGMKFNDINDYSVVKEARKILADADAIITHNGAKFDLPFLQTRLAKHDLPLLAPRMRHVDTCKEYRSGLLAYNNQLKTLAKHFTDKEKKENEGWGLWEKVYYSDLKAKKEMSLYCKQDVRALEEIFYIIRSQTNHLPNYNLFKSGKDFCPKCGSPNTKHDGYRYNTTTTSKKFFCFNCRSNFSAPIVKGIVKLPRSF